MLVYDPVVRPVTMSATSNQIGWYRANGSVETSATRISNNVEALAQSVVLNYLALHDDVGSLDAVLPGHALGMGVELDSLIALQPIRSPGS